MALGEIRLQNFGKLTSYQTIFTFSLDISTLIVCDIRVGPKLLQAMLLNLVAFVIPIRVLLFSMLDYSCVYL